MLPGIARKSRAMAAKLGYCDSFAYKIKNK